MTEAVAAKTGYTGLIVPGIAALMLVLAIDHLQSSDPARWRGGAPISPFAMFAMGAFVSFVPLWVSRRESVRYPVQMKPVTAALVQRRVNGLSFAAMLVALLIGAYAQQQILAA